MERVVQATRSIGPARKKQSSARALANKQSPFFVDNDKLALPTSYAAGCLNPFKVKWARQLNGTRDVFNLTIGHARYLRSPHGTAERLTRAKCSLKCCVQFTHSV